MDVDGPGSEFLCRVDNLVKPKRNEEASGLSLNEIMLHQRTHIPGVSGFGFGSAFDVARRKRTKSGEEAK